MRVGYGTSVQAADDFILNVHTLAKPWRALKNRMKLKTSCNHKEFSHGQKKMIEQYIQQLLTAIPTDSFPGHARNIMSSLEISSKIIDSLLAAKETGETIHFEFVKNWVTSHGRSFFETMGKSGIIYKEEKRKTPKTTSVL